MPPAILNMHLSKYYFAVISHPLKFPAQVAQDEYESQLWSQAAGFIHSPVCQELWDSGHIAFVCKKGNSSTYCLVWWIVSELVGAKHMELHLNITLSVNSSQYWGVFIIYFSDWF